MQNQTAQNATIVSDSQCTNFLPEFFGADFFMAEMNIYSYANLYLRGYRVGFWQFYSLPEGNGYLAPDAERVTVCNPDNYFEQEMSGEAAGIVITAMVLNHRSWMHGRHDQEELCELFCERHAALIDFARGHKERDAILSALD
ncbi:antirestriction protein [Pectobacterium parvum]|nr:antirestriction protein [Pectobacterium parvum]AZS59295.1 antirestriction protein [Pectobacterium parmentieri]